MNRREAILAGMSFVAGALAGTAARPREIVAHGRVVSNLGVGAERDLTVALMAQYQDSLVRLMEVPPGYRLHSIRQERNGRWLTSFQMLEKIA